MPKKSMLARERVRVLLSIKGKSVRESLRKTIADPNVSYEEKMEAVVKLNKRARDESPCRIKNRCGFCGRVRGVYRRFKLCRICLRRAATRGDMPGVTKASW